MLDSGNPKVRCDLLAHFRDFERNSGVICFFLLKFSDLFYFEFSGSSVENLALLVARVREDKKLVNALARFALQVQEYRHSWFRQLSSEAKQQSLATTLETFFNILV